MVILLTGANGFLGKHLTHSLTAAGHEVVAAVRDPASCNLQRCIQVDFTHDIDARTWLPRLQGIDVVINAVGILREHGSQTFALLHSEAPRALFAACAEAGIQRVIQISALGADEQAQSCYHRSKKEADDFLASLPLQSTIVQPSLIFGSGGASAQLFCLLASLPVIALPGGGYQRVQPVHVEDAVAAVLALLCKPPVPSTRLPVVGPNALMLRGFIAKLRRSMGFGQGCFLSVPLWLARLAARLGDHWRGSLLDSETLQMLQRGNTGDAAALTALLGHAPRPIETFIEAHEAQAMRLQAQLGWLLPLLRLSIAVVWIVTGIVSLGWYPVEQSYALLARVGITGALAPVMLYGAALLDIVFGLGTLLLRQRRWLWYAQIAVIVFYTLVISWKLPEFWLHPYGPLLKNLPMLAAIWMLLELEKDHGLHHR